METQKSLKLVVVGEWGGSEGTKKGNLDEGVPLNKAQHCKDS